MQNDETVETQTTDDTQVETQAGETEVVEETTTEGADESGDTDTNTTEGEKLSYEQKLARATTPEEKFAIADAEANKNRRLLHKANKPKTLTDKPKAPQTAPTELSVEETVLLAQGMPEELLAQLKKVAKVNGTGLIKAQTDSIFVAIKEKFEKEQKRKDASLGAGRGSSGKTPEKTPNTPGISRDEHKEMFYKKVRR